MPSLGEKHVSELDSFKVCRPFENAGPEIDGPNREGGNAGLNKTAFQSKVDHPRMCVFS